MNKFGMFLKRYAPAPAVTFVAGILVSVLVRAIFGSVVPLTVGVLSVLGIVFVVLASASQAGLREEIKTLLVESKLSAKVVRARKGDGGDTELYDAVTSCLLSATESIHAVSLFRPPTLKVTGARKKYYDALDKLLREKTDAFVYDRIIQVETLHENTLQDDQTDSLTFAHCQYALELDAKSPVKIYLRQTANILGSLSFFIIDAKQVVFVIPSATRGAGDPRALPVGSVVIFSDGEGSLVREMLGLFTDLASDAKRVTSCVTAAAKTA